MLDIIPDIHGQATKLEGALSALGYRERGGTWRHPDPGRTALFLGDLIDGHGDEAADARVLRIARAMVDAGAARCLMGNHELNAIHYHWPEDDKGPLRPHTVKNTKQHAAFLRDHPLGSPAAREAIDWMMGLPLLMQTHGLRAVYACWDDAVIKAIRERGEVREADGARAVHLDREALRDAAMPTSEAIDSGAEPTPLALAVETALKGPEVGLADGASFRDKNGYERREVRIAWWRERARTYRDAAISVPPDQAERVPDVPLPTGVPIYPTGAPPVVFGHYWLDWPREPHAALPQAPNALCLDFSAGKGGPLVTYRHERGAPLDAARLVHHGR